MAIIVQGREIGFLVMLFALGTIYYYLQSAKQGKIAKLRRLPQIDVIDELVARAVESSQLVGNFS